MRTLIQNYANGESTEALYLAESLSTIGLEAQVWSDGMSAFDKMDTYNPDLVISHYMFLSADVFKYLSSNNRIKLIVNVTGALEEELDNLESYVKERNINCPFFFSNEPKESIKHKGNIKIHSVLNGADIFAINQPVPSFEIGMAIVSDYEPKSRVLSMTEGVRSWHKISTSEDQQWADINSTIPQAAPFYCNYGKIIVTFKAGRINQHFFDTVAANGNVEYLTKYEIKQEKLDALINKILGDNNDKWQNKVIEKHTCLNRSKQILELLGHKDLCERMDKTIKGFISDYSNTKWL